MEANNPQSMKKEKLLEIYKSDIDQGLSYEEAQKRLETHGKNVLTGKEKVSPLKILFRNFNNIIVYLLTLASLVSFIMDEPVEGFAVIIAILVAVVSGFISEYKAEKSIDALKEMTRNTAKVIRDGQIKEISSENLVPGDIIYLEEGDLITGDGSLVKSTNFAAIESALTGESESVEKTEDFISEADTPLGDQKNRVFTGTAVTRGNAYVLITETGMKTELGKISQMIQSSEKTQTPLEKQLKRLGQLFIFFAVVVAFAVTLLGIYQGEELYFIIKLGIIIAIAAVPEALPAVSTITLALGMKTMAQNAALVKSLPAVETLGSTTIICTDKTGTLTENQMTVTDIYTKKDQEIYSVTGDGYSPQGDILKDQKKIDQMPDALHQMILAGVLSSNANLSKEGQEYKVVGDPTEGGVVVLGEKVDIQKEALKVEGFERFAERPFNSNDKYMVVGFEYQKEKSLYIKGAPDVLLELSDLSSDERNSLSKVNEDFAKEGKRVIGVGRINNYEGSHEEKEMVDALKGNVDFLGFFAIMDPPREDVKQAIDEAQNAGIRVLMITGDHPKTAQTIAKKIGISNVDKVVTGKEMDGMTKDELLETIKSTAIYARVSPENKLQIVDVLNDEDEITAMTGDGVNDAPALNGADIGIAMGIRGTQVAKDASDMILTDDQFSTIIKAVKEGRIIFSNIQKFIYFLFSCNVVEILAIFIAMIMRLPVPILALQILWLNLVVDVLPAMSLAWEPGDDDIMTQKPRDPKAPIVSIKFLVQMLFEGALIGLGSLLAFYFAIESDLSLEIARTIAFTTMAFGQLFHLFNVRGQHMFVHFTKNIYLLGSLVISSLVMLVAIYLPFLNKVMYTEPLHLNHWLIVLLGSFVPTLLIQGFRLIKNLVINQ